MHDGAEIVGVIAAGIVILTALPQLFAVLWRGHLEAVSVPTFAMYALGGLAWMSYGLLRHDGAIVVTNVFVLINGTAIVAITTYRRRAVARAARAARAARERV